MSKKADKNGFVLGSRVVPGFVTGDFVEKFRQAGASEESLRAIGRLTQKASSVVEATKADQSRYSKK